MVRLACLLTFTVTSRASAYLQETMQGVSFGSNIACIQAQIRGITYSTEKGNGSYPYCDRRRIGDSSLDGHLEHDAGSAPRNVRRVTKRSRPLLSSNQRGVEEMRIGATKQGKRQDVFPLPHDDGNFEGVEIS